MKTHLITLIVLVAVVLPYSCLSQNKETVNQKTDSVIYKITMEDGNQYIGTIIHQSRDSIKFKTLSIGTITIPMNQIKSIKEQDGTLGINGWPYQFQTTNYLTLNSAYGLKKGEGYYQNIWILFNNISYGVTDNFSIGAGVLGTFLFSDLAPIWATARLTTPIITDQLNAGGGAIIGTVEGETFGFLYGVVTLGPRDRNISVGFGKGFVNDEFSDMYLNIDGNLRVSKKFYLIMENYFIENEVLTFIGGRSILGRSSLEYGIMRTGESEYLGFPILGITLPLHKD